MMEDHADYRQVAEGMDWAIRGSGKLFSDDACMNDIRVLRSKDFRTFFFFLL